MRTLCLVAGVAGLLSSACSSSDPDGGSGNTGGSAGAGGASAGGASAGGAGGAGGAVECTTHAGPLPWALDLPGAEPNGVFDLDFAHDPETDRLWATYSGVTGPAGNGQVSTHLAYSEDGGATWCGGWTLNPATTVTAADLPSGASADEGHWNHETSSLVYDSGAPASERWRLVWHRYLVVDDGVPTTDDRLFAHGWYAQRRAATPDALRDAPEEKLFSGVAYSVNAATEAYNDAQPGGAPLHSWNQDLDLADCLLFAEPGLLAEAGSLYLATFCARSATDTPIVLVGLEHATNTWSYRGALLENADGAAIGASTTGFNGADLFATDGRNRLVVTPVSGDGYQGCVVYDVDLLAGTLLDADANGPDILYSLPATTDGDIFHWGACAYHEASDTGLVVSNAYLTGVTFRLSATGFTF